MQSSDDKSVSLRGVPAERQLREPMHAEWLAGLKGESVLDCKDVDGESFGLEQDPGGDVDFS